MYKTEDATNFRFKKKGEQKIRNINVLDHKVHKLYV